MLAENFAEQSGGRRKAVALQGRQRSYAEFYATDVKGFYLIIVLVIETAVLPIFSILHFFTENFNRFDIIAVITAAYNIIDTSLIN